jgi:hypothetical protein
MVVTRAASQVLEKKVGDVSQEDSIAVQAKNVSSLSIATNRPGARVYLDSLFIGVTPITGIPIKPGEHALRVLDPRLTSWGNTNITKDFRVQAGEGKVLNFGLTEEPTKLPAKMTDGIISLKKVDIGTSNTPLYVVAGSGLLAGISAAYLKEKADRIFGDYQISGDPSLWERTSTYDKLSRVSMIIFELSFAALAYLLLSE